MQPIVTDHIACLLVCHSSEPCKNGDRDNIWNLYSGGPKEACVMWGCTLVPPGECHWTIHACQRCGLLSNYFGHLV